MAISMTWAATALANGLDVLQRANAGAPLTLAGAVRSVVRAPIKLLAAFVAAPLLAFRIAASATSPLRRLIAGFGIFLGLIAAWFAATVLGSFTGAFLVGSFFGPLIGLTFLIGTTFSIFIGILFSIFVFNAVCLVSLHMSSQDIIEHLRTLSD